MSKCNHHPGAELLLNFASGKVDGLQRLMIELHQSSCPTCDEAIKEFEQLGGMSLSAMTDAPLADNAFELLMKRISEENNAEETVSVQDDYRQIITDIFKKGAADQLNWHWRTKRFAEIPLPQNDDNFEAKLIYFKKGMKVPRHTHRDQEMTLVLKGAFSDSSGLYQRGDYVCKTAADEHSPVAESDCICLAITTQPLKFTGTFGPVLNWFLT